MVLSQGQMKSESELSVRKVRGSTLFVLEQPLSHTNQPAELNLITPPEQVENDCFIKQSFLVFTGKLFQYLYFLCVIIFSRHLNST